MMYEISFAQFHISIDKWNDGAYWNLLKWKLDSFSKSINNNEKIDLRIVRSISGVYNDFNQGRLLYESPSGFFKWEVRSFPDGSESWEYIRKASGKVYLKYLVNPEKNRVTLLEDATNSNGQVAFELMGPMMPGFFLKKELLTFHSVLFEHQGEAIAVCANSGVGKTTHARLWREYKNALIINGDRTVCRKEGANWIASGIPWSGTSGEQVNRSAKMKAIVVLERGENNSARKLEGFEIFEKLFPHVLYPNWDVELSERCMTLFSDLLETLPVYLLTCRPDEDAVNVLYRAIWEGEC